ncbi:hypothetical protein [Microbacterium abyssi]|uniref:hypothetical protein n=1 Tax=Microbacterium abyssi TaxID=2782166 RepID=UPI001E46C63C|nr:hypothetical protein [Microbacterium sp. A18JL241]
MMMESDAGTAADADADGADVQEQQRPAQDDAIDPEQVVSETRPDGSRIDADPADVQEQALEVPVEEE